MKECFYKKCQDALTNIKNDYRYVREIAYQNDYENAYNALYSACINYLSSAVLYQYDKCKCCADNRDNCISPLEFKELLGEIEYLADPERLSYRTMYERLPKDTETIYEKAYLATKSVLHNHYNHNKNRSSD